MTKMDKEMMKQMEQFQRDFPDATPKEKRDFLQDLFIRTLFGISDDDPFGILKESLDFEQAEYYSHLNRKKYWETDADITVKDLLYRYAIEELSKQHTDIPADIVDEYDEENEAWWDGCIKAHASPETSCKTVKEQYVYVEDTDGYKWYRVTETGLVEAPDYIPPDNTK